MSMAPHDFFRYFSDPKKFGTALTSSPKWRMAVAAAEEAYESCERQAKENGPVPGGDPEQNAATAFLSTLGLQLSYDDM
jgi:hypothetical protein